MSKTPPPGTIAWFDLTVDDADGIRDFYADVIGWDPEPVSMKTYNDYSMTVPETGEPAAGVCHARGVNADLPAAWIVYVYVADLDESLARCMRRGGALVAGPKGMGDRARYAVIRDPAGAVMALFESRG